MTAIVEAPQPSVDVAAGPADARSAGTTPEATPGELLAGAVRRGSVGREPDSGRTAVRVGAHLPAAFPLFAHRPRYAVRHLLRVADDAPETIPYVSEAPRVGDVDAPRGEARAGTRYAATPEADVSPELRTAELAFPTLEVPVPADLWDAPADLFARFVDMRVLVRASVVENQTLLHGSEDGRITGLLHHEASRRLHAADADLSETILRTCADVEETGGSCDGLVVHPETYWAMVGSGLLGRLTALSMKVSRTRMCPRDTILFGDFGAAAQLHLANRSELALVREPGRAVIRATFGIGLTVPLPQHLVIVTRDLDGGGPA
ncbi:hypothetical protein GCM10028784_20490 [Myceligenerans cantabricum]